MKQVTVHVLSLEDGAARFMCVVCKKSQKTQCVNGHSARAMCCKTIHNVVFNRRKDAQSRTVNGRDKTIIRGVVTKRPLILADIGKGGIGITRARTDRDIDLEIGQKVRVQYFLCRVRVESFFEVRNITDTRVGLSYCDGKNYAPQQRVLIEQVC